MIAPDKRKAIYLLHQEGLKPAEIARRLGVSRNTVIAIITQQGEPLSLQHKVKLELDPELLRRLYQQCQGHIQRVYEKLVEEEKIPVKYSTLTRRLRGLGISHPAPARCEQFPDEPGAEMQRDTSVYPIEVGDQRVKVVASLLYLRYSKRRYLKFYPHFHRFTMKCFFHYGAHEKCCANSAIWLWQRRQTAGGQHNLRTFIANARSREAWGLASMALHGAW